jgi:hypothetical protein
LVHSQLYDVAGAPPVAHVGQQLMPRHSRIQIITAADVLNGKRVDMPPQQPSPFAQAPRERKREGEQKGLGL